MSLTCVGLRNALTPRARLACAAAALAALVTLGFAGQDAYATEPTLPADTISYGYDELGRLTAVIDPTAPSNGVAKYNYDAVGNITSIERASSSGVSVVQLSPSRGAVGSKVIVYGTGFSAAPGSNSVSFAGTAATVTAATKTQLHVTVPSGASTGTVSVTAPGGSASSAAPFTVVSAAQLPSISGFSPAIADPGTAITVTGSNFAATAAENVAAIGQVRGQLSNASASSLSLDVPAGATSGRVMVVTPEGSATSAGDLFVPPAGFTAAQVLTTDRMAIGDLNRTVAVTDPAKVGLVVFDANAGQHVFLNVPTASALATVKLFDPFGVELAAAGIATNGGYLDTQRLPTTGTYTILVDPLSAASTVTLSLYGANPNTGTIQANGQAQAINGLTIGQNATRTFTGTQNQRVFLRVDSQITSLIVRLRDPSGVTLATTSLGSGVGFIDTQTLQSAGTYTIEVDPSGTKTGNVTLTLYDVPADGTGTITPGGSAQTVSIGTPGQNATRTFSGTAGQRVALNLSNVTIGNAACSVKAFIYNPDGTTLASNTCVTTAGGFVDTSTLPATGTYSILLDPIGVNTGNATLTLYDVPADSSGTITPGGGPQTMTLTPGQNGTRTFSGNSGQQITLTLSSVTIGTSTCCSAKVSIQRPDGTNLVAPTSFGTTGKTVNATLNATGTHTILIDPQAANAGSVTLTLTASGGGGFALYSWPSAVTLLTAPAQAAPNSPTLTTGVGDVPVLDYQPGTVEEWLRARRSRARGSADARSRRSSFCPCPRQRPV